MYHVKSRNSISLCVSPLFDYWKLKMQKSQRSFLTCLIVFIAFSAINFLKTPLGPMAAKAQSLLRFEANLQITDRGKLFYANIVKDGAKFHLHATDSSIQDTIFDGNIDGLIWEYESKSKKASPDLASNIRRVYLLVNKYGKERIQKEYKIPNAGMNMFMNLGKNIQIAQPRIDVPNFTSLGSYNWKPNGKEKIADCQCEKFSYRNVKQGQVVEERIWLHRKSGLILKKESMVKLNPSAPWIRNTILVTRIKFIKSVVNTFFRLPVGTIVSMPETYNDVKNPDGLIRNKLTGEGRMTGVSFGGGETKVLN